jgi:hypothetical protein
MVSVARQRPQWSSTALSRSHALPVAPGRRTAVAAAAAAACRRDRRAGKGAGAVQKNLDSKTAASRTPSRSASGPHQPGVRVQRSRSPAAATPAAVTQAGCGGGIIKFTVLPVSHGWQS